jgi:hypothetical protein
MKQAASKLKRAAVNGDFSEPPRLLLIRAADIDAIDNWPFAPITWARNSSI